MKCRNLNEVRENIDRIDKEIVKLVAERGIYVSQAANFKKDSEDVKAPQRVEKVISKVRSLANDYDLNPYIIERVYREMINCFINAELTEYEHIRNKEDR